MIESEEANTLSYSNFRQFFSGYPRLHATITWLFTSRMTPTALGLDLDQFSGLELFERKTFDSSLEQSNTSDTIKAAFTPIILKAIPIDGYQPASGELICADGTIVKYKSEYVTPWIVFWALLGVPTRPQTFKDGKLQFSFLQFLRNLIGGWNPVKETIEGVDENSKEFEIEKSQRKVIYQKRWTEKKIFNLIRTILLGIFFVIYNLVTWPFRLLRNIRNLITEFLLPLVSVIILLAHRFFFDYFRSLIQGFSSSQSKVIHFIGILIFGLLSLTTFVLQYTLSLACRIGLAFTSPLKSALLSYKSGREILGSDHKKHGFSISIGVLGFILSLALSVTAYTIFMPLALGALVAAIPGLLTPIHWLSEITFFSHALAWLNGFPFIVALVSAYNTAFELIGAGLAAVFGPAIRALASLVSLAMPEVVLAVGTILATLAIPVATLLFWAIEALNNALYIWVEQRPFHTLLEKIGLVQKTKTGPDPSPQYTELPTKVPESWEESSEFFIYQNTEGGKYWVSSTIEDLRLQAVKAAENAEKAAERVETFCIDPRKDYSSAWKIWNRAKSGTDPLATMVPRSVNIEH